jgi:hypothetical protein
VWTATFLGENLTNCPTESKTEFWRDLVLSDETANAVCTEMLLPHVSAFVVPDFPNPSVKRESAPGGLFLKVRKDDSGPSIKPANQKKSFPGRVF